jgi:hypothetical protein
MALLEGAGGGRTSRQRPNVDYPLQVMMITADIIPPVGFVLTLARLKPSLLGPPCHHTPDEAAAISGKSFSDRVVVSPLCASQGAGQWGWWVGAAEFSSVVARRQSSCGSLLISSVELALEQARRAGGTYGAYQHLTITSHSSSSRKAGIFPQGRTYI